MTRLFVVTAALILLIAEPAWADYDATHRTSGAAGEVEAGLAAMYFGSKGSVESTVAPGVVVGFGFGGWFADGDVSLMVAARLAAGGSNHDRPPTLSFYGGPLLMYRARPTVLVGGGLGFAAVSGADVGVGDEARGSVSGYGVACSMRLVAHVTKHAALGFELAPTFYEETIGATTAITMQLR